MPDVFGYFEHSILKIKHEGIVTNSWKVAAYVHHPTSYMLVIKQSENRNTQLCRGSINKSGEKKNLLNYI